MIKIGIIGCGKIAEVRHAPEYNENPNSELVAYYDANRARAELLQGLFGGTVYDSVDALLASDVDAVSVCVANVAHAEITIAALEAGKHVLCEKPMATTLADCEAMNAAADKAGKYLMIAHNQRLARAHVKARALIEAGEIGDIISFRTVFGHPGPEGWTGKKDSWFFDKKKAAFGAMADLGVHKTDLLHFLCGDVIDEVSATITTLDKTFPDGSPITVDDNSFCIYRMRGGATGTMHVSWTFYGEEDNSTILYGTEGIMRCYADPTYSLIVEKPNGERTLYELDQMTSNKEQTTGGRTNTGVIDAFIESLVTDTAPAISGKEAIQSMRVIFAAEKSAETGETIKIAHNE